MQNYESWKKYKVEVKVVGLFVRLLVCISFVGLVLYKYIDKMNELTELRLTIPVLKREVKEIREKNLELQYAIERFESPLHLMELARNPEFGYLKYPSLNDVLQLPERPLADFKDKPTYDYSK